MANDKNPDAAIWEHFGPDPENRGASSEVLKPKNERTPTRVYGIPNARGAEKQRDPMRVGSKSTMHCEVGDRSSTGHSGAASHIFSFDEGHPESDIAVCQAHLPKLIKGSISRGETNFSHRNITPNDVAPIKALRAVQAKEVTKPYERMLRFAGMEGPDARIGVGADQPTDEEKKADAKSGDTVHRRHLKALNERRTPEQGADILSSALEKVRVHGGHPPKIESTESPTPAPAGRFDEKGRIYTFPKKTGPRKPRKEKEPKENPEVTDEEIRNMPPAFAAISRETRDERRAAGIPVTGIPSKGGFQKGAKRDSKNRPIATFGSSKGSTINVGTPVRPVRGGVESFIESRAVNQRAAAEKELTADKEAKRLRSIEAKKTEHQGVKRASRSNEFGTGRVAEPSAQVTKGGTVSGVNTDIEALTRKLLGE